MQPPSHGLRRQITPPGFHGAEALTTASTQPAGRIQPANRDPAWMGRLFWACAGVALLLPALIATEFKPWILFEPDSLRVSAQFAADFFPPKVEPAFLTMIARETWRTVAIATAGLALGLLIAIPLAVVSTTVLSVSAIPGRMHAWPLIVRQTVRVVLIVLRSVPELVWALVFVRVVGLGPTAGVLAIALTYGGMLGKVFSEILESDDRHAAQSLLRNGAGRLQTLLFGALPQSAAELTSYTVYRWECAIRSSAVLGFVGAGGLGQQMDNSMKMFNGSEVAAMLTVFFVLVAISDAASARLRSMLG